MVKIITSLEATLIEAALEAAFEVLEEEGYDDEAKECKDALRVIGGLAQKEIEKVIK